MDKNQRLKQLKNLASELTSSATRVHCFLEDDATFDEESWNQFVQQHAELLQKAAELLAKANSHPEEMATIRAALAEALEAEEQMFKRITNEQARLQNELFKVDNTKHNYDKIATSYLS